MRWYFIFLEFSVLANAKPLVIGHRGASAYFPEHTIEAYDLAIQLGADMIEPDLVSSSDGYLIARHENEISGTTDIADHPEFAARRKTKIVDGQKLTGWFTEDFTLAEIRTLYARERIPEIRPGNVKFNDKFRIATFQQVIELAAQRSKQLGRRIGVYPETKHSSYFRSIGLSLEEPLIQTLKDNNLNNKSSPVIIQSFEVNNLLKLRTMTDVMLAQLIAVSGSPYDFVQSGDSRSYADLITAKGLRDIIKYADIVAVDKRFVVPSALNGNMLPPTNFVTLAHSVGLKVHIYTLRPENNFLPSEFQLKPLYPSNYGNSEKEILNFIRLGIDGFFTDAPERGLIARYLSNSEAK